MRCAAITKAGARCKGEATHGSYCWNHAPETAEARKQRARRGGRAGGNGRTSGLAETAQARSYIRGLVTQLINGTMQREIATACFQGLNVLARYIELERRIRETDELEVRIEVLEARQQLQTGERGSWPRYSK
jgi:hypothetical protein